MGREGRPQANILKEGDFLCADAAQASHFACSRGWGVRERASSPPLTNCALGSWRRQGAEVLTLNQEGSCLRQEARPTSLPEDIQGEVVVVVVVARNPQGQRATGMGESMEKSKGSSFQPFRAHFLPLSEATMPHYPFHTLKTLSFPTRICQYALGVHGTCTYLAGLKSSSWEEKGMRTSQGPIPHWTLTSEWQGWMLSASTGYGAGGGQEPKAWAGG